MFSIAEESFDSLTLIIFNTNFGLGIVNHPLSSQFYYLLNLIALKLLKNSDQFLMVVYSCFHLVYNIRFVYP